MGKARFSITRINNASVLINLDGHYILTDPYFIDVPFIGVTEQAVISAIDLPPLTAIIGCHDVIDHWQMEGLQDYPHNKDDVQILVAMEGQVAAAKKAGFNNAEVLSWGSIRHFTNGVTIESVEAQKMLKWTVNNYVIRLKDTAIFFGSEARDIPPLAAYHKQHGAVDVALLPVNGVYLMSCYQLVMRAEEAVKGARTLGAKTLFVIHDAHKSRPLFLPIKSSGEDAERAAAQLEDLNVVRVPTGQEWAVQ